METTKYVQDLHAFDELQSQVHSPEDQAIVDVWQEELNGPMDMRKHTEENLGKKTLKLVQMPNGSIATVDEVAQERAAGHDMGGSYSNNRRA